MCGKTAPNTARVANKRWGGVRPYRERRGSRNTVNEFSMPYSSVTDKEL